MNNTSAQLPELERLRAAVRRTPGDFIAWLVLADAEMSNGAATAGESAVQRALALRPGHPEALARLGRVRWLQGRHLEAARLLQQAADMVPQHPGFALWLGHALEDAGQAEPAAVAYARAHHLLPDEPYIAAQLLNWRRRLCDWSDVDKLSQQVRQAIAFGQSSVEPFAFLSEDASPAEQLACAQLRAAPLARHIQPLPPRGVRRTGALRVGLMSNGFAAHPTGLLTVALLEQLHRQHPELDLHLFALNPDDRSTIRARLSSVTTLHDCAGQEHAQLAARIRSQQIDLLFDLRGWGGGGAPEVLAMRPAPIQINWLAYPGTSGAPWMDYVLGDGFTLPRELEAHYSEQILRLPRAFQPSDDTRQIAPPPSRHACGLPETGIVFCCFNNSYKLNRRSFTRMLAVVRQVEGSVLWLLSGPGHADQRLRMAAQAQGVNPQRLCFMAKMPHPQYLSRYRHADLFLDTSPYNAHTTASDALWAGCPILTVPGTTFASRVAGSLNHHLGLDRLNATDDAAFVASAVQLAHDPSALAAIGEQLHCARNTLFDMRGFADDFAHMIRELGKRHGWHGV